MEKSVCYGTGLVALDVILNGSPDSPAFLTAGGSCGNVLTILSFLGIETNPIARLANDKAAKELVKDLTSWNVNAELVSKSKDGSTPVIIHRILKDKNGKPKHKFEFKDPDSKAWLPQYKPVLSSFITNLELPKKADVFYFDRASRGTIDLAEKCKKDGALIFFEPPSISDVRLFTQAMEVSDVIKFSSDRIPNFSKLFRSARTALEIRTLGVNGLEFRTSKARDSSKWKRIEPIPLNQDLVVDTAGAGDWCSAGIIKTLLSYRKNSVSNFTTTQIITALQVGQSYSAVNICFVGARGAMYQLNLAQFIKLSEDVSNHEFETLQKSMMKQEPISNLKVHKHLKISSLYL